MPYDPSPRDPNIRASDDDRDRVAGQLREHHAVGRLSPAEFQERLELALEARTLGELAELTADLPAITPAAAAPAVKDPEEGRLGTAWRQQWAGWFAVNAVTFTIWLISFVNTGNVAGFWFLWVAGPWGAILLSRWAFGLAPKSGQCGQVPEGHGHRRPELG